MIRFSVHYFLLFALMGTVVPYMQLLLGARGFDLVQVGFLQGLMAMAGVCGSMGLGYLADRLGKRRTLLIACVGATGLLVLPLAGTSHFVLATVLVAALGFVSRAAVPLADAITSSELPDAVHRYGRVRTWGSAGFVVTLLVIRAGGLVDEKSAWSMATWMALAAAMALASALPLPDRHGPAGRRPVGEEPHRFGWAFGVFLFVAAMHQFGMASYYNFFSKYLRDALRMDQTAWVWALGSAAEIPMLFFAGRIIRRLGLVVMLILSMGAISVRLALYAAWPTLWVVLPAQALHALVFGFFHAASIEFIRRRAPARRRGLAMALYTSLAIGLPSLAGSTLGGWIIERWGYAALYATYAAVPLIGIAVLATTARRLRLGASVD